MPDEAAADYIQNKQAAKPATATEPTTGVMQFFNNVTPPRESVFTHVACCTAIGCNSE
jgi:hypothetical protein